MTKQTAEKLNSTNHNNSKTDIQKLSSQKYIKLKSKNSLISIRRTNL